MAKVKFAKDFVEDFRTKCCLCEEIETKLATKVCHECDLFICGECLVWHAKFPFNKDHCLVPLENKIALRPYENTEKWNIQGVCQTSDGSFLLLDLMGDHVLRFDSNFLKEASLRLTRGPMNYISICVIDHGRAAVGGKLTDIPFGNVEREMKIIKIRPNMETIRSFKIDLIPNNIAYSQGKLYICGGTIKGLLKKTFGFSQGYIAVYSEIGFLMHTIPANPDTGFFDAKLFGVPLVIECINNSIYVVDEDKGLMVLDDRKQVVGYKENFKNQDACA